MFLLDDWLITRLLNLLSGVFTFFSLSEIWVHQCISQDFGKKQMEHSEVMTEER